MVRTCGRSDPVALKSNQLLEKFRASEAQSVDLAPTPYSPP